MEALPQLEDALNNISDSQHMSAPLPSNMASVTKSNLALTKCASAAAETLARRNFGFTPQQYITVYHLPNLV